MTSAQNLRDLRKKLGGGKSDKVIALLLYVMQRYMYFHPNGASGPSIFN